MSRTLLKNGYVVTVDEARAVHPRGYVAIADNKIEAVGADDPTDEPATSITSS